MVQLVGGISSKPYWAYFEDSFSNLCVPELQMLLLLLLFLNEVQPTAGQPDFCPLVWKRIKNLTFLKWLKCHDFALFSPKNNIFHIELPLLSPFDEESPTESKMRSTLEIDPKMASKYVFLCFYTVWSSSTIYHIYIILLTWLRWFVISVNHFWMCICVH